MITTHQATAEIIGHIRIQPLTPWLVRIEQQGPSGYEDRPSFTVVSRDFSPPHYEVSINGSKARLTTAFYQISVPADAETMEGIRIETPQGTLLKKITTNAIKRSHMPTPSDLPQVWIMADSPRIIPPEWGALPPPDENTGPYAGWDTTNHAQDVYIFFPLAAGYDSFKADFLELTGSVPLPPLYTFGLWYSRYHPYNEQSALAVIDTFRKKNIPLDVFVCDTDWRVGASCGYGINTNLFPDMPRFIARAHERNVYLMYNDHPEPVGDYALQPKELNYRQAGLTSLFEMGADAWWFDRNWHVHLQDPAKGLNKEVWGMKLYHDITLNYRPDQRPLIMSNVDGINNGHLEHPSHPAAHRYPIWWTGDTLSEWDYLKRGVQNGVDCGILALLPYVNEDLGGHIGHPDAEYYTRFMQFGAFSPVTRIHCTCNHSRYPWQYDSSTEEIVAEYFRLRYRLLPTIYTAAFKASQDATPLMQRCDLQWADYPEARDNTQYLFTEDMLVAPMITPAEKTRVATREVWIPEGQWEDAWSGITYKGPVTITIDAPIKQLPLFIRKGGIIITAPQTYATKNLSWSNLTVDIYVPSGNTRTTRWLYEDDGRSNAYTNDIYGLTELCVEHRGHQIEMTIQPSAQFNHFVDPQKTWTLRMHMPENGRIAHATLNNKPLSDITILNFEPTDTPPQSIFKGAGSRPAQHAGPVVEITLPDSLSPTAHKLIIEWTPL